MAKKQIVICSPQLGLDPDSFLGGEVHDVNIINQLSNKGIKCLVLLPKGRKYKKNHNLQIKYLPIKPIIPPHLFNLLCLPYLFKSYRLNRFDILRLHNPYFLGFAGFIFKTLHPKVKLVTTIHLAEERADLDQILRLTINIYDHIFTVSEYLKSWLVKKYKFDPNKITVIYNGLDPSLKPAKKDLSLTKKYKLDNKIVLLNMGLMIARKNVLFLLDILNQLSIKHPNLVLLYIGKGPLKSKILQKSKELGLSDKVIVADSVTGNLKKQTFNLADIFLFPSLNEGFGLVAAEAMACGKVVVGSDNSSIPEVIKPGTGFVTKSNNIKDWAAKIEILLSDKKLRLKMGKNAKKYVQKKFNWSEVATKTIEVYRRLVDF